MPNIEELMSRILRKIADGQADDILISKFDFDYAYAQLQFSKRAKDLCILAVTEGYITGDYQFFLLLLLIFPGVILSDTLRRYSRRKLIKRWETNTSMAG